MLWTSKLTLGTGLWFCQRCAFFSPQEEKCILGLAAGLRNALQLIAVCKKDGRKFFKWHCNKDWTGMSRKITCKDSFDQASSAIDVMKWQHMRFVPQSRKWMLPRGGAKSAEGTSSGPKPPVGAEMCVLKETGL